MCKITNLGKIGKKKIIISVIVVLILAAGGFFCWQNREIKGSPDDYVIKKTKEGKIVENKKAGLVVKVPEGWEVKKMEADEGLIVFYSPNTEGELQDGKIAPPLKTGCTIHIGVVYEEADLTQLKLEAKYNLALLGVKSEEFEETTINNYRALKITADTQKIGSSIGIDIPYKNKVHSFLLLFAPNDKENCIQEFNKFLETISIK
jgi:hypothetical protein